MQLRSALTTKVASAAYRSSAFLARNTPLSAGIVVAKAAVAAPKVSRKRRILVRRNLERVLDRPLDSSEATKRVGAVFEWYARYHLESFKLPKLTASTVDAGFVCEDDDRKLIESHVRKGVGPILVLPHLGTWEWAAWWLALIPKMKVTAVVEPLNNIKLFEWFQAFRNKLGIDVIPADPSAIGQLTAAVRKGHIVCLVSDRDISGGGTPATFFGERTRLPTGPAVLALRTGAPLLPTAVYWHNNTRRAVILPPVDIQRRDRFRADISRVVQDYAKALEQLISLEPEQWHLMSPNWPSDYEALNLPVPSSLKNL